MTFKTSSLMFSLYLIIMQFIKYDIFVREESYNM